MKIYMNGRGNNAIGRYEDGKVTVLKGSIISEHLSKNFVCQKKVELLRNDKEYVDKNRRVLKNITFSSPSTAAQFVKGYSTNGWKCWKDEKGVALEKYKEI
ncbi:MAG: DUF4357 domain-containing protein [Ruminococcus sp.]|nr:DUF4357 domain-containing protein [Ruminococcus sp.]